MTANEFGKTRLFFHEARRPAVMFAAEGRVFSGHITDVHDDGFTIVTGQDFSPVHSRTIDALYVGTLDAPQRLEDLRISRARHAELSQTWTLTVFLGNPVQLEAFRALLDGAPVVAPSPTKPGFDHTRLPAIPVSQHYSPEAVQTRLGWLRQATGQALPNLEKHAFRVESLAGNIENFIGAVQVPVGVAGPLLVNGLYTQGHVPVPIATTEGALVASLNRGASALNLAGGVTVNVRRQRMLRAPVFFCRDLHGAINFERWLSAHIDEVRARATSVSSVARLVDLQTFVFGRTCHVQFIYETGDASGQNMTTSCTAVACEWICAQAKADPYVGLESWMIEGNMSSDKKVSAQNMLAGRGVGVLAEAFVSAEILSDVLHADLDTIVRHYQASEVGAMQVGMLGHNVNCANVIAGVFAATGQDIASVHESSVGMLKLEPHSNGISLSLFLPSLVIGTVGGGTRLPTQQECLQLMRCAGQGKLFRLAEIIAASCLALDLSTMCAVMTNEFVAAHARFGRNRKTERITRGELDRHFLRQLTHHKLACPAQLQSSVEQPLDSSGGLVSGLVSERVGGVFGLRRYALELDRDGCAEKASVVLKLKSPHDEVSRLAAGIVRLTGDDQLPGLVEQGFDVFGFGDSDAREIELYRSAPEGVRRFMPEVWGTQVDPKRELFAVLLEDLAHCTHLDTTDHPEAWTRGSIEVVLRDLAALFGATAGRAEAVCPGLVVRRHPADFARAQPMFEALLDYQQRRSPEVFCGPWVEALHDFVAQLGARVAALDAVPLGLSHNDFNPRNLALRPTPEGPRLVAYDWELASVQSPVHDAIEFLIYALPRQASAATMLEWLSSFRRQVEVRGLSLLPAGAGDAEWAELVHGTAVALALFRLNLYWLLHNVKPLGFLERISWNLRLLIEATGNFKKGGEE